MLFVNIVVAWKFGLFEIFRWDQTCSELACIILEIFKWSYFGDRDKKDIAFLLQQTTIFTNNYIQC